MNTTSVYTPLKDYLANIRKGISARVPLKDYLRKVVGSDRKGAEALANQKRVLVETSNQIKPEKTEFASTKEMFKYAMGKIIPPLKSENPYEYTVVVNIKDNKVLAEYIGDTERCLLKNLESLPLDDENVVFLHGHPGGSPISNGDLYTLLKYKINQVIAFDENGQFSMVARRRGVPAAGIKSDAYEAFKGELMANKDTYYETQNVMLNNRMLHYTLSNFADRLGIRYVTNYDYLKNPKFEF